MRRLDSLPAPLIFSDFCNHALQSQYLAVREPLRKGLFTCKSPAGLNYGSHSVLALLFDWE